MKAIVYSFAFTDLKWSARNRKPTVVIPKALKLLKYIETFFCTVANLNKLKISRITI